MTARDEFRAFLKYQRDTHHMDSLDRCDCLHYIGGFERCRMMRRAFALALSCLPTPKRRKKAKSK